MSNRGAAMSNGRPNKANSGDPLRQQLSALGVRAAEAPLPCFGERLARLFDLSDTVALDAANIESRDGHFAADGKATERLRADLDEYRARGLRSDATHTEVELDSELLERLRALGYVK